MAGVVLVTEFDVPEQGDSFSGYINYMDRETAKEQSVAGYLDYMENEEKTDTIFTNELDEITVEQNLHLKKIYDTAQKNGSLLWKTVITFENDYLENNGIYNQNTKKLDKKKLIECTRKCMDRMLKNENMLDSSVWSGAIHYNTDNLHIHIATVEPIPTRPLKERQYITLSKEFLDKNNISFNSKSLRYSVYSAKTEKDIKKLYFECQKSLPNIKLSNTLYITNDKEIKIAVKELDSELPQGTRLESRLEPKGKFKQSSINKGKSAVINEIINSQEVNLKINSLIRDNIISNKREHELFKDKELVNNFIKIYNLLPDDKRLWRYNMHEIQDLKPLIDDLSEKFIEKYHQEDFKQICDLLELQEQEYTKGYGEGSENHLKENKIQDLYTRLGNTILTELRQFDNEINTNPNNIYKAKFDNKIKSFKLVNDLNRLKRNLNNDVEHFKNQQAYKKLQEEIENDI